MSCTISDVTVTLHNVTEPGGPEARLDVLPADTSGILWYASTDGSLQSPLQVWYTAGYPITDLLVPWSGAGAFVGELDATLTDLYTATAATFLFPAFRIMPDLDVTLPINFVCKLCVRDPDTLLLVPVPAEPIVPHTLPGAEWALSTGTAPGEPDSTYVIVSQLVLNPSQLAKVVCRLSTHAPQTLDVALRVDFFSNGRLFVDAMQAGQLVTLLAPSALPTVQDVRVGHTATCGTVIVWWTLPSDEAMAALATAGITQWVVQNVLEPRQRTTVDLSATSVRIALPAGTRCTTCVQYALYGIGAEVVYQTPQSLPSPSLRVYPWPHHLLPSPPATLS